MKKFSIVNNYKFNNSFMLEALAEAKKAYLAGEVPVGCVVVLRKKNKIIARAHNLVQKNNDANAHAEILALRKSAEMLANKVLDYCDIYVTLEPCTMCAAAIANARIGRLYYALDDLKHGAVANGVRFFTTSSCFHRPEIYSGICKQESYLLMKSFFGKLRVNKL